MTILEANKWTLARLEAFLDQLTDNDYQQPLDIFNGSTLGEHTRHIIEFYRCLISQRNYIVVNYDLRERKQLLQQSTAEAKKALDMIAAELEGLELDTPLMLEVNPAAHEGKPETILTNLHRELHYVLDHTIHHMAIIKIGVRASMPHIKLHNDFGVAPSTIRSRSSVAG